MSKPVRKIKSLNKTGRVSRKAIHDAVFVVLRGTKPVTTARFQDRSAGTRGTKRVKLKSKPVKIAVTVRSKDTATGRGEIVFRSFNRKLTVGQVLVPKKR